jgi:hypothetical protein
MSDITKEELDAMAERTISMILEKSIATIQHRLVKSGAIKSEEGVSISLTIDIHGVPLKGTAIAGNPARMAKQYFNTLLDLVKQEDDFDDLIDVLDIGSYDALDSENQLFLDFADQMANVAGAVLSRGMDNSEPSVH